MRQDPGARRGNRRLATKILVPILLALALFSGGLGFWVSGRILEGFLAEARRDVQAAFEVTHRFLGLRAADLQHRVTGAVRSNRLADLVERGLLGPLGAAARDMAHDLEADLVQIYDRQGELLGSSRELGSNPARDHLGSLRSQLAGIDRPALFLGLVPAPLLSAEAPSGSRLGDARLARIVAAPVENDFGDRAGLLLVVRDMHRDEALIRDLGSQMGVRASLLQGHPRGTRASPSDARPTLSGGFPAALITELARGQEAGEELAEGEDGRFAFRAGTLEGEAGEPVGALAITLDVGEFYQRAGQLRNGILAAGALALVVFAGLVALVVRGPTRALARIAEHMGVIARGGLGEELQVHTGDELEALAHRINQTVTSLRGLIGATDASFRRVEEVSRSVVEISASLQRGVSRDEQAVQVLEKTAGTVAGAMGDLLPEMAAIQGAAEESSRSLAHLGEHLQRVVADAQLFASTAEQTASGMHEMSASVSQVADSMAELSRSIEETSQSMTHVDGSVREIEELAGKTREVSTSLAEDSAGPGRAAMDRARGAMRVIGNLMGSLAGTIDTVESRSQEIGQITTLITDIAKQTRLLAFNAAILASQAGERGTGFRVVADNIRALSERTTSSLNQVRNHVRTIQEASTQAREEGTQALAAVEDSSRQVDRVGEVLARIVSGTGEARTLSERIAWLTTSHAAASGQVSAAMQQVAGTALQVAAAAQQQDATGREILKAAEQVGQTAAGIRRASENQAQELAGVRRKVVETASAAAQMSGRTEEVSNVLSDLQESTAAILEVVCQNRGHVEALNAAVGLLEQQADDVRTRLGTFRLD